MPLPTFRSSHDAPPQPAVQFEIGDVLRRAVALHRAGRWEDAAQLLAQVLAVHPHHAEALYNRGLALAKLGRHEEAVASYDLVLAQRPDFAPAFADRGAALTALGRSDDALASYERALVIDPTLVAAHYNRSALLSAMKRFADAAAGCEAALRLAPDLVPALNNRGSALIQLKRHEEALASLDRALRIEPDCAEALYNRGIALADLRRHDEASRDFARVAHREPALPLIDSLLLHSRMHCCDWQGFEDQSQWIVAGVRAGLLVSDPFTLLAIDGSPADQLDCARTFMGERYPAGPRLWQGERYRHERIRLAYLSADLREHPVAHLMAEVFERHDRRRFEVVAVSWGPAAPSPMRARLERGFDTFLEVSGQSDAAVAERLRALEIDIAVDLTGITAEARTGILARRPAPVQVNYLGYPGSMGAEYIDYLLADRYLVPEAARGHYAEQVVYLPETFQPSGSRQLAAVPKRAALGLPEQGVVLCSFNNSYKITPALFAIWMRILTRVPGSVLWLVGEGAVAGNLKREAAARGVDPGRLVLAPRVGYGEHLARCAVAELFLDTLPFNGGSTASDALWAGLPVLSCSGEALAGRMAGSLLQTLKLPELITATLGEYEARAMELASDAARLAQLKAKLGRAREATALFDGARFQAHLEAAYIGMWERSQRGLPPASFAVPAAA